MDVQISMSLILRIVKYLAAMRMSSADSLICDISKELSKESK